MTKACSDAREQCEHFGNSMHRVRNPCDAVPEAIKAHAVTTEGDHAIEYINTLRREHDERYNELRSNASQSHEQLLAMTTQRNQAMEELEELRICHDVELDQLDTIHHDETQPNKRWQNAEKLRIYHDVEFDLQS